MLVAGHPTALIDVTAKLAGLRGTKTVVGPSTGRLPLVIPESLDDLYIGADNDTPREFVCPLTFALMRQPVVTPHGTAYDFAAGRMRKGATLPTSPTNHSRAPSWHPTACCGA